MPKGMCWNKHGRQSMLSGALLREVNFKPSNILQLLLTHGEDALYAKQQ